MPEASNSKQLKPIQSQKYRALAEHVAEWLAKGCAIKGTAHHFGLCRDTVHDWLKNPHFSALVEQKKEEWRQELLGSIQESKQWTAKAWLLERSPSFEGAYAPPQAQKDTGPPIVVQIAIVGPREQAKGAQAQVEDQPPPLLTCDHDQEG